MPARSTALMWTKTSLPPSSGWMNPKPFCALNHFTVPVLIVSCLSLFVLLAKRNRATRGPRLSSMFWEVVSSVELNHARPSRSAETRWRSVRHEIRFNQDPPKKSLQTQPFHAIKRHAFHPPASRQHGTGRFCAVSGDKREFAEIQRGADRPLYLRLRRPHRRRRQLQGGARAAPRERRAVLPHQGRPRGARARGARKPARRQLSRPGPIQPAIRRNFPPATSPRPWSSSRS